MTDIAAQIPPRARRVVELGVSRERAGEAFLRIQPQAEYFGVVSDQEEMKEASLFLTHVFCATPETLDFEAMGLYEADVLIIRENFLEGLTGARLRKWCEVLTAEGLVLMEVPNACYIRPYLEQLAGKKPGKLHGFTAGEVREILQEAGLFLLHAQGRFDSERDQELRQSEANKALLQNLQVFTNLLGGENTQERNPWLKSFFFKAARKALQDEDKLLVQTVLGETIVTPRVRIVDPGKFLSTEAGVTAALVGKDEKAARALAAQFQKKIFIRQRISFNSAPQAFTTLEVLRRDGYLILGEIDDNPQAFMKPGDVSCLSYMGTHAMQVSTEPLAEILRQYNPHVQVIRNQLTRLPEKRDYEAERQARLAKGEDYVTFFFGALNRTEEWQQVMPIINEAARKYGSRLRFKVLSDRGFFESLATEYKEYIGNEKMYGGQFVPYHMYEKALGSSDISFLPLRDNAFNRTKSDLKFIESAGYGAVAIASPTVYEATLRDGRTGFIYRSPQEFKAQLELLVENRERRLETADAAYNYVKRERLLANHYQERLMWYRELIARREELDKEMVMRLKEWQSRHPEAFVKKKEDKA
ncbi:glycosyltransferase [Selenomonas sp. AB3002]|uniref:glycosyltransferase family protein n=1 Tax=Selenomonas sp. AB3002 TaxID=1392502 RepID=UPI00049641CA